LELVEISVELRDTEQAEQYLSLLTSLGKGNDDGLVQIYIRTSKALMLKYKNQLEDKSEAKKLFIQLINDPSNPYIGRLHSQLNLLEILIDEYTISKDSRKFDEIFRIIQEIYEECQIRHLYLMLVRILLIRSKLELVRGGIEKSIEILTQASLLAEEKGLAQIGEEIQQELQHIQSEKQRWAHIIEKGLGQDLKIDKLRLKKYLAQAIAQTKLIR
jgi:hypothetical protein